MNKIVIVILLLLLSSCEEQSDSSVTQNTTKSKEFSEHLISVPVPRDILDYFNYLKGDSIVIEVETYTLNNSFQPKECLPLAFLPMFQGIIPQTQSESTGAKPVGKIQIEDNCYLLVLVQQDDYGPIYYGLIYNKKSNSIQDTEKLAETWGDAGDSAETSSIITIANKNVVIKKHIRTCHAELEIKGEEVIEKDAVCKDSTTMITMKTYP